jgi:aminoglycoside phosphotransferase (APT) family kinase protein
MPEHDDNQRMVTRSADELIAHGNTSDVFRWGSDAVVKVLKPGIPTDWANVEAETTDLVHATGLPAPAVLDMVVVGGRPGIVFEYIDGESMWDRMLAKPDEVAALSRTLADLQTSLNATPAPDGLPSLHDRLRRSIQNAARLTGEDRALATALLEGLPAGNALCHFDTHPENVLLSSNGPVLIDWFDAVAGEPAADVVRTSVLLRHGPSSDHMHDATPDTVWCVHEQYMARTMTRPDLRDEDLVGWLPLVVAGRLAEPVQAEALLRMWDQWAAVRDSKPSFGSLAASSRTH